MQIKAGIKLPNGKLITSTMSDAKWDLLCLTDRLFHPEKYGYRVDRSIYIISERLKGEDIKQGQSVDKFIENVRLLPLEEREQAEKDILRQIAELQ